MGTIKIELDLPDFRDELEINIVIKKDGNIIAKVGDDKSPALAPTVSENIDENKSPVVSIVDKKATRTKSKSTTTKKRAGNLMDMDFL